MNEITIRSKCREEITPRLIPLTWPSREIVQQGFISPKGQCETGPELGAGPRVRAQEPG